MQKFEYRSPRFAVDLPVQFTIEQLTVPGRCRNISKEGMGVELGRPLPPGTSGTASLGCHGAPLEISVRVAYSGKTHDGVVFLYKSDRERQAVARLVASLAHSGERPRLVILN